MNNNRGMYRGPLRAVIFDWAGTTVDYGSLVPIRVLQKVFAHKGIEISEEEARRDMGLLKKDHIRSLMLVPRIATAWSDRYHRAPTENDVESLFAEFIPQQISSLAGCSSLIEGVTDAVQRLRDRKLKIGSTTGYTRPMLDVLLQHAARLGYVPDCALCPDDVGAGRPLPWMIYENAVRMKVFPLQAIVKVGDTISDIEEGLNAGTWTVGVSQTGNMVGLTERAWHELPDADRAERLQGARRKFSDAGAHYVVDTLTDFEEVIAEIELRLQAGEYP